jgi:hypothetical protein
MNFSELPLEMQATLLESGKKRKEFMVKYRELHKHCPNCGSTKYTTTLAGYIYLADAPDEYKDENDCTCHECGNFHQAHDRISKEQWDNKSLG